MLSRELADRRVFPAIDLKASSTRREELLLANEHLEASRALRRHFADGAPADTMSQLLALMKQCDSLDDLVARVRGQA